MIEAMAGSAPTRPLLDQAEWAALKRICSSIVRQIAMARRYIHSKSRLRGSPSGRGASRFSLSLASFLAIIIVRSGLLEIEPALATFAGALAIAVHRAPARVRRLRRDLDGGPRAAWAPRCRDGDLARAARLSGLSRHPGLQAAVDLRHHHRPASIRRATRRWRGCGRAMPTRSPMPAFMPPSSSAQAYPDIGPLTVNATPQAAYDAALRGDQQAQMARRRCARPAGRTPRGPHRGGGAHADHGLPRRRRRSACGRTTDGARIDIALVLALRQRSISAPMPRASAA